MEKKIKREKGDKRLEVKKEKNAGAGGIKEDKKQAK